MASVLQMVHLPIGFQVGDANQDCLPGHCMTPLIQMSSQVTVRFTCLIRKESCSVPNGYR